MYNLRSHCMCDQFLGQALTRQLNLALFFSERELLPSVCLSVICLSSVTLVRPTHAVEIFGNISIAFGTLTIR